MTQDFVIHIVDDDAVVRDSLRFVLEAAEWRVRDFDSAHALLNVLDSLEPGFIITDVRMPGMTGLELVSRLKRRGICHPVIVLTGHADVSMAVDAMKSGVVDFIEKPFEDNALLRAVEAARKHLEDAAGVRADREEIGVRLAQLTTREKDVFDAVVAGESNKSTALKLGISPRTVEVYRANVMEKMRARSLSDLVRMALLHAPPA